MTLKTISEALQAIAEKPSAVGLLTYRPRPPYNLVHGLEQIRPHWQLSGVYVLAKLLEPEWNVPFEEGDAAVWYVGMTAVDIFKCMERHFGRPRTGAPVVYEHRWTNGSAPSWIGEYLQRGEVVLYPIEVPSATPQLTGNQRNLLPGLVEKQLLVAYVDRYGTLPPLNLSM
ncbi:hypothetical protein [Ralstonia solanacearum]|uniref:hypothetical protein n=1 Tax=Ralstonia solanacearum TaxID=305 RepID=UPI000B32EF15|nr:hypothetical protein [Ralstonia solanacearum]